MYDRAMQALDACQYAFICLSHKNSAQWVLEGDIKGCFDNINHDLLIRAVRKHTNCKWMERNYPQASFCRYADDGVVHCRSKVEALRLREILEARFGKYNLELHSEKTRIVYCKDDTRREEYPSTSFDFLGFTFRPMRSKNRWCKYFINFTPAVSNKAANVMRQKARRWKIHLRSDKSLDELSRMLSPIIKGWMMGAR